MKKLLVFFLLAYGFDAAGQGLPMDSTTHKVTYQGVVQVPGATQAELYSRAREWFATSFGSSKAVLEMDSREVGKLVGRANATFSFAAGLTPVPWPLWHTIILELKDGRYKYTITHFSLGSPGEPEAAAKPIEPWLGRPGMFLKDGKPRKITGSLMDGVQQVATLETRSIAAAMTTHASKTDW